MVRFIHSTNVASVALLLALPGWTTGAGELFKSVVGMASAADTNRLAQDLASAVSGGAVATGANLVQGAMNTEVGGALANEVNPSGANPIAQGVMGNMVSRGGVVWIS